MSNEARSEDNPLDWQPTIFDLQRAAEARCEKGPFDNPSTAYRECKRLADAVEALRGQVASQEKRYKLYQHIAKSIQHALHGKDIQKDILEVFNDTITRAESAEAENAKLAKEIEIRKQAMKRYAPCPDHGGKAQGGCLLCRAEIAEGKYARLVEVMKKYSDAVKELAFEMDPPNKFTPQFVQLSVRIRQVLTPHKPADKRD